MKRHSLGFLAGVIVAGVCLAGPGMESEAPARPAIFPIPRQIQALPGHFLLDETARILVAPKASASDLFLARSLAAELSDRCGLAVQSAGTSRPREAKRPIVIGAVSNPLVAEYCARRRLPVTEKNPGPEGYVLEVTPEGILIAGSDERGAFYGLQSLRQLLRKSDNGLQIPAVRIRDWPYKAFRGVKVYLPGPANIAFFKRFVRDFMALYKFNHLILEVNAGMRLERHPELNAGWVELAKDLIYSRRDRPEGPHREYQDSTHHDTADGAVLEKGEVAELTRHARRHYIEVVPEIPSLTHSYYLLTRHRELAEVPDAEWPDAYCPSNPKSYDLLFDVFDEYIEVMKPRTVHIGHDEWRVQLGACPLCRGKDPTELFARDVRRIHEYLAGKGIRAAMWGDHLIESVRGKGPFHRVSPTGFRHEWPGALSPGQVRREIPKDILIMNWFWRTGNPGEGESNDLALQQWGFRQVYGNLTPEIDNYGQRSARPGVMGGAPSSWAATTEFNFGKDLMYDFLGCANLLWSKHWPGQAELAGIVQALMPDVRRRLGGTALPSEDGDPVSPINMTAHFNAPSVRADLGIDASGMRTGTVSLGPKVFDLSGPHDGKDIVAVRVGSKRGGLPAESGPIPIGEDVSSLIFLHASARPAQNDWAYRYIYNFADTADLLGHYEVVYDDGLVETIPIRYGVNILEWSWPAGSAPRTYCYRADPVACGGSSGKTVTLFAFEWLNPRFGKTVRELRLRGSAGFRDPGGNAIRENAVILKAISVVRKRPYPEPVRARPF